MEAANASLLASLKVLSSFFVGDATMSDTLTRVSELAREANPGVEFVGMTMMVNDRPATAVFTDTQSPEIDQAQYSAGRGPCLESFRTGEVRVIDSARVDGRWPEFNESCLEHDILSTLSLPLTQGGNHFGAMNLYSRHENAFGAEVVRQLSLFAEQASIVLANAAAYWDARQLSERLSESIEPRAVIEQAKGIIMGSMRCTADQAFNYLVQQSQHTNTKLRDIAAAIVKDIAGRSHG